VQRLKKTTNIRVVVEKCRDSIRGSHECKSEVLELYVPAEHRVFVLSFYLDHGSFIRHIPWQAASVLGAKRK